MEAPTLHTLWPADHIPQAKIINDGWTSILVGKQREFCRSWPNQTGEVTRKRLTLCARGSRRRRSPIRSPLGTRVYKDTATIQTPPFMYMFANFTVHDAATLTDRYREYEKGFFPILKRHEGTFFTYDDNTVTFEGSDPRECGW